MNIIESIKNNLWPALGTICGIVVGAAVNFWENRSIFRQNSCYANALPSALKVINDFREDQRKGPLFSSTFPIYTYPAICFTAWNLYKQKNEESRKIAERQLYDIFVRTLINGVARTGVANVIRYTSQVYIDPRIVDISGHAMNQTLMTIHAVNSMQTFSKIGTPFQQKCNAMILLILSVGDLAWMYNTTRNCHSIIDVAAGVAVATLAFFAVRAFKL